MDIVFIAIAAMIGGITGSLLGWLTSEEPFDSRKFIASLVTAMITGVSFAAFYQFSDGLTVRDIIFAFLSGAGVDSLRHRISGSIKAGIARLSKPQ